MNEKTYIEFIQEARAAKRRKPSKSVAQLKAEIDAKNPTEDGITGKQIPKKKWKSAPKRHEFEKERRAEKKKREGSTGYGHSGHLMGGSTRTMAHNRHDTIGEGHVELDKKRQRRMTDQAMRHMDNDKWENAYSIENERDTQTPEVSQAKAAANKKRGEEKRKG